MNDTRPGVLEQLPLKDIHLPDPVSWWPPAPGWWLLPVLLALLAWLVVLLAGVGRRRRARRRLRDQALGELQRIERHLDDTGDLARALEHTSVLLRRVALTVYPDHGVAGRVGADWTEWLRRTGPEDIDPAVLDALARAPYRPDPGVPGPDALATARRWIDHATRRRDRSASPHVAPRRP